MANHKVLHGIIATGFRVGGIESSKELNVCILSLTAESMGIVRKEVPATSMAEFILVGFYSLGENYGPC